MNNINNHNLIATPKDPQKAYKYTSYNNIAPWIRLGNFFFVRGTTISLSIVLLSATVIKSSYSTIGENHLLSGKILGNFMIG